MSKILKNNTASPVDISDVGVSVPASGQLTINATDELLFKASDDVVTLVGNNTLTVNDGSSDLSISEGIDLIKGIFPNPIKIEGANGTQIQATADGSLKSESSFPLPATDAFNRLRVSNPNVIFETSFVENDRSDIYDNQTSNGGSLTYNSQRNHLELDTTTASGSQVILQSTQRIKYTPGQSNLNIFIAQFDSKANLSQRVGLHDGDDGFFFESRDGTFGVTICNSYSGTRITNRTEQTSFNLDTLDGTGPSGITLDITKPNIYLYDYQWLGAGTIRWGVFVEGKIIYFHQENHANIITDSKYMRTANLPIRVVSENTGATASSSQLIFSCCSVLSEGFVQNSATQRSQARSNQRNVVNSEYRPIISLRLKSTAQTANLKPISFDVQSKTSDDILVEVRLNPTLSNGTSWQDVDSFSSAQYDVGSDDVSGGTVIDSFFVSRQRSNNINLDNTLLKIGKFLDGSSAELSLVAISLNNNANVYGSITWEEVY